MLRRCQPLLGTFVEICATSEKAIDDAFEAVATVHRLMSAHDPDSNIARLNRLGCAVLHPWTAHVLDRARFWSKASDDAFDVVRAGKEATETGYLPLHPEQPASLAASWRELEIDGTRALFARPGCVDLGGIAKGFAVDRAINVLREAGVERGLVNAGGDLRAFGPTPWPVQVVDPRTRAPLLEVSVADQALATSGALGGSFLHLPDADRRWIAASVRAPTCMDADALAKILLAAVPGASHCLAIADAEGLRIGADGSVEPVGELCAA